MARHTTTKRIATLDCETDPFQYGRNPQPFIWGFFDGISFKYFFDTEECINHIMQFDGIIYAHNGGKFDYHFILDNVKSRTKVMVINGRIAKMRFGKAELRDSYNILPIPLKAMEKDDFEYWKLEKEHRVNHMPEIIKYLRGDCTYLYKYIIQFIDKFDLQLTQASAAFNIWHEMADLDKPVMIGEKGQAYYDAYKKYYYGGRVTPFKSGVFTGKFEMVDIKSAYPCAMCTDHPYGHKFIETMHPTDSKMHLTMLSVKGESFGAFPLRSEKGNKLDFPHTKGIFHVTGHEFMAGLETGTFKCDKILEAHVARETINFTPYVERFFKMKQDAEKSGDKAQRLFAKLFLNSLYGKYAALPSKYTEDILIDIYPEIKERKFLEKNDFEPGIFLGNNRLWSRKIPPEKQQFYNVVTAASITGWVRAFLWKSILQVDTPYYCDTDSIICAGKGTLPLGTKLGEWELEKITATQPAQKLAIAGKKMYCLWNNGKTKLASKGAKLTPKELLRIANGETITYRQEAPTYSLKSGIRTLKRKIRKTV